MAVQKFNISGRVIHVQVDGAAQVTQTRRADLVPDIPTLDPEEVIGPVVTLVDAALDKLLEHVRRPDEVEFSVGIKFGVEGGIIVAKGSAEANMNVSLKYATANLAGPKQS